MASSSSSPLILSNSPFPLMASSSSSAVILSNSQSSLMASSSSSLPRTWRYRVFTSFHGPDVRKSFLSHLRKQFDNNGITMFNDEGIERGQTIAPALKEAIRDSRISLVVLSKNYASSSWCLDELVEILDCKETMGQIVMTVFYDVDPSHVRKQTEDFGRVFKETCEKKTEEDKRRWSQALKDVANIEGEHFRNWSNEAKMIEKIAKDVSDKLNLIPSWDFGGMVGLETHLREMESMLDLEYNGVKIVAIYGPAGIGKTTIARALHSLISHRFQHTCFVENLSGSYHSGLDEYGLKFRLQEQLLSKILNQDDTKICNLSAVKERLCDLKVLIILDDVNDIKQLEALANETTWFGHGSRIIVTTENKELLQRHGINNTYNVGFPSDKEALEILCRYAFRKSYPHDGFKNLAFRVTEVCGNLPLGLRVVGSSLHRKNEDEWEYMLRRLKTNIVRDIENVLRVSYESLDDNEQTLVNRSLISRISRMYKDVGLVKSMLTENNLDIKFVLQILVNRSLIYISNNGEIVMHKLLQQVGIQVIHRQKPSKRRILIDAHEICDVLENDTGPGGGALSGISFDTSGIYKVVVSNKALRRMRNLWFLRVYNTGIFGNNIVHIPEEMEFPPSLRLLQWIAYPNKSLSRKFCLQNLVELDMRDSKLEKLWEGTQRLPNLKKMDLSYSFRLKELPDLSNSTNLERLNLYYCSDLVELPSSIGNLHKLKKLDMHYCKALVELPPSIGNLHNLKELEMEDCSSLEVIPNLINLASLELLNMDRCSRLRTFPDFSTNLERLNLYYCMDLVELPSSIGNLHKLRELRMGNCKSLEVIPTHINLASLELLDMSGCSSLRSFPDFSTNIRKLFLSSAALVELPSSIGNLQKLWDLRINDCTSLEVIPTHINLASLELLDMSGCSRLRTFPDFSTNVEELNLTETALVELPSSIGNLHKLKELWMEDCKSLEVIPTHINLASLRGVYMNGCSRLRTFPDFSTNIERLSLNGTLVEEVPASIKHWSRLSKVDISGNGNLKTFTNLPARVYLLNLSNTNIEKIPDSIHSLQRLIYLYLNCCRKLTSLPELPDSLRLLNVDECGSLQKITSPLNTPNAQLSFTNCFKLSGEARRTIIQGSYFDEGFAFLPGRVMPREFNHRARGNSLTIPLSSASSPMFKACVVIPSYQPQHIEEFICVDIRCIVGRYKVCAKVFTIIRTEHLCIFHGVMPKTSSEAKFEFQTEVHDYNQSKDNYEIIECGVLIMTEEPERSSEDYDDSSYEFEFNEVLEEFEDGVIRSCDSESENVEGHEKHITDCWSWLSLSFDLSNIMRNIGSLCWRRKQIESIDQRALHEHTQQLGR